MRIARLLVLVVVAFAALLAAGAGVWIDCRGQEQPSATQPSPTPTAVAGTPSPTQVLGVARVPSAGGPPPDGAGVSLKWIPIVAGLPLLVGGALVLRPRSPRG